MIISELIPRLEKFIEKLPEPERNRPLIAIKGRIFSWKEVLEELKKGSELSNIIINKLEEMRK